MKASKITWICDQAPVALSAVKHGYPHLPKAMGVAALVGAKATSIGALWEHPGDTELEFLPQGIRVTMHCV